jgi:hypothetical protein
LAFMGARLAPKPVLEPVLEPVQEPTNNARTRTREKNGGGWSPSLQKTPMPSGWEPDAVDVAFARDLGLGDRLRATVDQFRDHHLAKGTFAVDWHAAWRLWCRIAVERAPRRAGSSGSDDDWGLRAWLDRQPQVADEPGLFSPRGWGYDALLDVMCATDLPKSWRGPLEPLGKWVRDGYRPDSIALVIAEGVGDGIVPRTLKAFDHRVRSRALWWRAKPRGEWIRRVRLSTLGA